MESEGRSKKRQRKPRPPNRAGLEQERIVGGVEAKATPSDGKCQEIQLIGWGCSPLYDPAVEVLPPAPEGSLGKFAGVLSRWNILPAEVVLGGTTPLIDEKRLHEALLAYLWAHAEPTFLVNTARLHPSERKALEIAMRHPDEPRKRLPEHWEKRFGASIPETTYKTYLSRAIRKLRKINLGENRRELATKFHATLGCNACRDLLVILIVYFLQNPRA